MKALNLMRLAATRCFVPVQDMLRGMRDEKVGEGMSRAGPRFLSRVDIVWNEKDGKAAATPVAASAPTTKSAPSAGVR